MATTVVNKSQAVKDKDGYAGYTFRLEVIMNSYNSSVPSYNVTINHYAKGDNATNHKYHGLTTPKSVIKGVAGSTTYGDVTTTVGQITGSETLVATWTGDIRANADGNLNITYSASYNANKSSGYLPATHTISETVNMPTIPRYATITKFEVNKRDETSLTVNWAADVNCNAVQYRIRTSGGSFGNWTNTSGTTFNITGLTANTTYVVQIQVRRTDSGLWTQSSDSTGRQTTYDYPTVTSTPNFVIGNPNTITFSNPLGRSCAIYIKTPTDTEKEIGSTTTTTIDIPNTSVWQSFFYNGIPNSQEGTYRVRLVCSEISRDTTVDGGTYSININDNRPDFTNFASQYTADLTSLTHNNQTVIKGQSTITYQITTGATAKNGASITKYTVTWTGATTQTITNIANNVTLTKGIGSGLTITAYDSRNIPNTKTIPFSDFVDYFLPKELVVNTHRKNGVEETVYGDITGKIYYDTLGTNGEHNTLSTITYSVEDGGTNMDYDISTVTYSGQDLTKHEQVFTIQNVTLKENTGVTSFDTNTAYTVSFKITDTTGKYTIITGEIKSGKFALVKMQDENGDYHVGVNGLAEDDCALRVHGKVKSESTVNVSAELNEDYGVNFQYSRNLFNIYDRKSESTAISTNNDGWVTFNYSNTSGSTKYPNFYTYLSNELQPNKDYWLVIEVKGTKTYTGSSNIEFVSNVSDTGKGQFETRVLYDISDSALVDGAILIHKITARNDFSDCYSMTRSIATVSNNASVNITFRMSILDYEPTVNNFNYEAYAKNQIYTDYNYSKNLFNVGYASGRWDGFTVGNVISTTSQTGYRTTAGIQIEPNTTYTLSGTFDVGGVWLIETDYSGKVLAIDENRGYKQFTYIPNVRCSMTITTVSSARYLYWYNASGTTPPTDFMIELGSTMTDYEPYAKNEPYSESVGITIGKDNRYGINFVKSDNLLNMYFSNQTVNGVARKMNGGLIVLNGTTSGEGNIYYNEINTIRLGAGTYRVIAQKLSGSYTRNGKDVAIYLRKPDNTNLLNITGAINYTTYSTFTLTEATNIKTVIYTNGAGMVLNNLYVGIRITKDTSATTYEPYVYPALNVNGLPFLERIFGVGPNQRITDINTVRETGIYQYINSCANIPSGVAQYGTLIVLKVGPDDFGDKYITQIVIGNYVNTTYTKKIAIRTITSGVSITDWYYL